MDSKQEEENNRNVVILATDFSGSTGGCVHYHSLARDYLYKFKERHKDEEIIFLIWDDQCKKVSFDQLKEIHEKKEGGGTTEPQTIPKWIIKNIGIENKVSLMVITDGLIDSSDVKKCAKLNEKLTYSEVDFVVITERNIDLSVGAAFFSNTDLKVYENEKLTKTVNTAEPFNYDAITPENFFEMLKELNVYIQAKFMGSARDALSEADKLTHLSSRLIKEINEKHGPKKINIHGLRKRDELLNEIKKLRFYNSLFENSSETAKIDSSISRLRSYLNNSYEKSYKFEDLKLEHRLEKYEEAAEEEEPEADKLPNSEVEFFDIVTLENSEKPILLLYPNSLIQSVWKEQSYSNFKNTVACPLFLINHALVSNSIGQVYDLQETYRDLKEHGIDMDPKNRRVFGGGIIPFEEADKFNDYVLAKTFFEGKKIKNLSYGLMYFTLWKTISEKEWIDDSVKEAFRKYALRRIEKGRISISIVVSSPLDPSDIVSEHLACYYCMELSSILFGENQDLFSYERLRMFCNVSQYMMEILEDFGYELDKSFIRNRSETFRYLSILKKIPKKHEKYYYILEKIFKKKGPFLVSVIENEENMRLLKYLTLNHKDLIPFSINQEEVVCDLSQYASLDYFITTSSSDHKICSKTFRPYFVIKEKQKEKTFYSRLIKETKELTFKDGKIVEEKCTRINPTKLLSLCKMYIDYVSEHKKYPNLEEFTLDIQDARKFKLNAGDKGGLVRLFASNVLECIKITHGLYQQFVKIGIEEFVTKSCSSLRILDRIKEEGTKPKNVDALIKERSLLLRG